MRKLLMVGLFMAVALPAGAATRDQVITPPGFDLDARTVASPVGLEAGDLAPVRLASGGAVALLEEDQTNIEGRAPEGFRALLVLDDDGATEKAAVERVGPRGLMKMLENAVPELPGDNLTDDNTNSRSRTRQTRHENQGGVEK